MSRGQRKPELKVQWKDEKGKELAQVHEAKLLVLCKLDTVHLTSLELIKLLSYTKGCPDRWSKHTSPKFKSKSSKSESIYFEWLYAHILFSCFSRGFYRTYGTIFTMLIMHSCLSCTNDRCCDRY